MAPKPTVKGTDPFARRTPTMTELTEAMLEEQSEAIQQISGGAGIEVLDDGTIKLGHFYLTPVGLYADDDASFDDWVTMGFVIKQFRKVLNIAFLDHLSMGRRWGELPQLAAQFGYKYETLKTYLWVVSNVDLSIRIDKLTLAHYRVVAPYSNDPEYQRYWLQLAAQLGWSKSKLEQAISQYPKGLPDGIVPTVKTTRKDPLDRFQHALEPFELKLRKIAHKAGKQSKSEMANRLRRIADEIERGEG